MNTLHPFRLGRAVLAALLLAPAALRATESSRPIQPAPAVPNPECLECHEAEFKPRKKGQPPEWIGVKADTYATSAHGKLACVECHTTIAETPHPSKLPAVQCAACHEKARATHVFHPRLALTPGSEGKDTSCKECHGSHDTVSVKRKEFAFFDGGQTTACGRCHEAATKDYLASAHALTSTGRNRTTPDCLTCH